MTQHVPPTNICRVFVFNGLEILELARIDRTLADGITRCALFYVWKEEQETSLKINAVLSLVRTITDFEKYIANI
ncbi:UNVERIFIED_CONTAM: hypothetical protein NCL1_49708 [Trichonephila clavipes]